MSYFVLKNKYIDSDKFTIILGFLLLFRFLISQTYQISSGVWDINHSLPLHLCGISSILSIFILFRYNQTLYEYLVLLGAPGALWSFLTPEINISEPSYMYVDYFISHAAIIFTPLYLTVCLHKKPRLLSYLRIFIVMNIFVMPFVAILNIMIKNIFNSTAVNYMYLMHPPQAENPFVADGWMYMLVLEITAFAHMFLIYSIFIFISKFKNKTNPRERFAQ